MKNLVKENFAKNPFGLILGALVIGFFALSANAAVLLLPAGSNVNDVAADSLTGTVYITKTDGTLYSSANGYDYTLMELPDANYPGNPCSSFPDGIRARSVKHKAHRITVDTRGVLWAVMTKTDQTTSCSNIKTLDVKEVLYRRVGSDWLMLPTSPEPVDVGVSSGSIYNSGNVFVTGKRDPYNLFYTSDQTGSSAFTNLGSNYFLRVDAKATNWTGSIAGAWAVKFDGTLWSYTTNVIPPGLPWTNSGQTNVRDVAVNKLTGRVYISKYSQVGGTIWYSDNNGATFQQEPATGFQNLAVTSNGVLYGAGYNGTLWRF